MNRIPQVLRSLITIWCSQRLLSVEIYLSERLKRSGTRKTHTVKYDRPKKRRGIQVQYEPPLTLGVYTRFFVPRKKYLLRFFIYMLPHCYTTFFAWDSIGGRLSARELQRNASNKKGETEILKRNPKAHAVKNITSAVWVQHKRLKKCQSALACRPRTRRIVSALLYNAGRNNVLHLSF